MKHLTVSSENNKHIYRIQLGVQYYQFKGAIVRRIFIFVVGIFQIKLTKYGRLYIPPVVLSPGKGVIVATHMSLPRAPLSKLM